jgi:superfamily I DNA and/or RNA helicase
MEFLYSLNRLNVATSRARCLAVVVANPALIRVRARTPRQMKLANALCRFIELAAEDSRVRDEPDPGLEPKRWRQDASIELPRDYRRR